MEALWTQHETKEYSSHWVFKGLVCVGHVDFMLFVSISFALAANANVISGGI